MTPIRPSDIPDDTTSFQEEGELFIRMNNATASKAAELGQRLLGFSQAAVTGVSDRPYCIIQFDNKEHRDAAFRQLQQALTEKRQIETTPQPVSKELGYALLFLNAVCQNESGAADPVLQGAAAHYLLRLQLPNRAANERLEILSRQLDKLTVQDAEELLQLLLDQKGIELEEAQNAAEGARQEYAGRVRLQTTFHAALPRSVSLEDPSPLLVQVGCAYVFCHAEMEVNREIEKVAQEYFRNPSNIFSQAEDERLKFLSERWWPSRAERAEKTALLEKKQAAQRLRNLAEEMPRFRSHEFEEMAALFSNYDLKIPGKWDLTEVHTVVDRLIDRYYPLPPGLVATEERGQLIALDHREQTLCIMIFLRNAERPEWLANPRNQSLIANAKYYLETYRFPKEISLEDQTAIRKYSQPTIPSYPEQKDLDVLTPADLFRIQCILPLKLQEKELLAHIHQLKEKLGLADSPPPPLPAAEPEAATTSKAVSEDLCAAWTTIQMARDNPQWLNDPKNQPLIAVAKRYLTNRNNLFDETARAQLFALRNASSEPDRAKKALLEKTQAAASKLAAYGNRLPPKDFFQRNLSPEELIEMSDLLMNFDINVANKWDFGSDKRKWTAMMQEVQGKYLRTTPTSPREGISLTEARRAQPQQIFTTTMPFESREQALLLIDMIGPALGTHKEAPLQLQSFDPSNRTAQISCSDGAALVLYSQLLRQAIEATKPTALGDFVLQVPRVAKSDIQDQIRGLTPRIRYSIHPTPLRQNGSSSTFLLFDTTEERNRAMQQLSETPAAPPPSPTSATPPTPLPSPRSPVAAALVPPTTTQATAPPAAAVAAGTPPSSTTTAATQPTAPPPAGPRPVSEDLCAAWIMLYMALKEPNWLNDRKNQTLIATGKSYLKNPSHLFDERAQARLDGLQRATSAEELAEKALLEETKKAAQKLADYAKRLPPKESWRSAALKGEELTEMFNLLWKFDINAENKWDRGTDAKKWNLAVNSVKDRFSAIQEGRPGANIYW